MKLPLSKNLTNNQLSLIFDFISGVLDLKKANPFRVRAYDNAAATLQLLEKPWYEYVDKNQDLTEIPGIGEKIALKLKELRETGDIAAFEKYSKTIPTGVWALNKVHNIGVKKAFTIAKAHSLKSEDTALEETAQLAKNGQLQDLPGFGKKSEQAILTAIQNHHQQSNRMPLKIAQKISSKIVTQLKKSPAISKAEVLGSIRRQSPTVGDIDIGIATSDIKSATKFIQELPEVKTTVVAGEGLIRLKLINDLQVDIKVAPPAEWGSFIQHFTGSKNHNIKLRELALSQNKSLSEHGIKDTQTGKQTKYKTEKEFYNALGLKYIPPEQRSGANEIEQAKI